LSILKRGQRMYDDSPARRNYLGGVARNARLPEEAIGRFIDLVRAFSLDEDALVAAMLRSHVVDADLFGISRISQPARRARRGRSHGRTVTWTVRLYVRSASPAVGSFADSQYGGTESALVAAMRFRDLMLRTPHQPRGPYHSKRPRPPGCESSLHPNATLSGDLRPSVAPLADYARRVYSVTPTNVEIIGDRHLIPSEAFGLDEHGQALEAIATACDGPPAAWPWWTADAASG
jgi:hypothetical protein